MKRMLGIMERNGAMATVIATATILTATTLGVQAGPQAVSNKLIVSAKTPSYEPSVLGIKLLQEIFQKIHNMPALAIQNMQKAKQNMIQQTSQSQIAQNGGPTNPLYAIKPPVTNTPITDLDQGAKIAWVAGGSGGNGSGGNGSGYKDAWGGDEFAGNGYMTRGSKNLSVNNKRMQIVDASPVVRDFRPARATAAAAPAPPASTPAPASAASNFAPAYSTNAQPQQRPPSDRERKQLDGFQQLASSLGMFGKAINGMQYVMQQQSAEPQNSSDDKAGGPQTISTISAAPAGRSGVTVYGGGVPYVGDQSRPYIWNGPALQGATNATRAPADNIYGDEGLQGGLPGTNMDSSVQDGSAAGGVMTPANPGSYKYIRQTNVASEKSDAAPVAGKKSTAAKKSFARVANEKARRKEAAAAAISDSANNREIALLPPNVITGIPLVHLGTSAAQANRLLATRGKLSKLNVKAGKGTGLEVDWSVWTLTKPGTNDPAMYIYMRHGIIEALRVFDTSLVTSDFGVELGAPVSEVKRKFGEPAFIIREPGVDEATGGQDYVYPISQVCFQIARKPANPQPQLVSILIFTVKDP